MATTTTPQKRRDFIELAIVQAAQVAATALGLKGALTQVTETSQRKPANRPVLATLDPINNTGMAFGGLTSGFAAVTYSSRLLLVFGHNANFTLPDGALLPSDKDKLSKLGCGISIIDFVHSTRGWRVDASSSRTRRFTHSTPIALDGAWFSEGQKLERHSEEMKGVGAVDFVIGTPWGTVLCAEREQDGTHGWVVEVDPVSGIAIARMNLGCFGATSIHIDAQAGRKVQLYMTAASGSYRFESHQVFDAKNSGNNMRMLSTGTLYKLNPHGRWQIRTMPDFQEGGHGFTITEPEKQLIEELKKNRQSDSYELVAENITLLARNGAKGVELLIST